MYSPSTLLVIAVAAVMLAGCASSPTQAAPPTAAHDTGKVATVAGITVHSARFGTGTNVVDVTDRVVELLRTQPQGFTARADWFGNDPRPYKRKAIVILYDYKGASHIFLATDERITADLLIKNAK